MNVLSINPNADYLHRVLSVHGFNLPFQSVLPSDRVDISFGSKDYTNVKPINLEQANNISGIHCPGCGIKMLSQNEFDNLMKRAENIHSTEEFVELLKEYRKFIPTNMRKILSNTDNPEEYKNKSIKEYCIEHRSEAFIRKRERIHRAKDYLIEYAKNIEEDKRNDFLEKVQELTSKDSYYEYKNKILYLTENYNIPQKEQHSLKKRALKDVATSSNYFIIFSIKNFNEISDNDVAKILVRRIFSHSVSNEVPMHKYSEYIDHPHNKVLLCKNCMSNSSKYIFWKSDTNPKLKDNIFKYLSDLAKLMGENKIENNKGYINTFCHVTNLVSSGKINFNDADLAHLYNLHRLVKRHEEFAPIVQTKVDIPCAQCGSVMLPHAIRSNIEEELSDCCCPKEYAQVLEKYYKYIGNYSKDFAEEFLKIINNNTEISNEEFIQIFQRKADKILRYDIAEAMKKYSEAKDYIYKNRSEKDIETYNKVNIIVNDYLKKGGLEDYNYIKFFKKCFSDLDLRYTPKNIIVLISDIHRVCYKASLVAINNSYNIDDNDALYTILFNLFKSDVATADHLIALMKGGDCSKDNLIGLCKGCNSLKSNKSVKSWYTQDIDVRKNFLPQLMVIDKMAKKGEITGFDDWAKHISQTMYEKTDKAFDLRKYFD